MALKDEVKLDILRERLIAAKDRLALERLSLFALYPMSIDYSRETYAFAYLRAERLGIVAIQAKLAEISWLPTRLDVSTELDHDNRVKLAAWVKHGEGLPNGGAFGNEFLHVLARCLLLHQPQSEDFTSAADRVAELFRDMSYLVAAIHCCAMFKEMGLEHVRLSAPHRLDKIAFDLTVTLETFAMMQATAQQEVNENHPGAVPYLRLVPPGMAEHPAH